MKIFNLQKIRKSEQTKLINSMAQEIHELSRLVVLKDREWEECQLSILEVLGNIKLLLKSKNYKAATDYANSEYEFIKKDIEIGEKYE